MRRRPAHLAERNIRHILERLQLQLLANLLLLDTGKPMPPLKGEFLSGKKAVLPAAAMGKVAMDLG